MFKKTLKWHLCVLLKIPVVNETGKAQKVYGSTYDVTVQPGQRIWFSHDDAPAGY